MIELTPFTEPEIVLAAIKSISDPIHLGLHSLLPKTRKQFFESQGYPIDKALHSMMTRYELRMYLAAAHIAAVEEKELPLAGDYRIEGLANCGLVINAPGFILRVLKCPNNKLPRPHSQERFEFYQGNLFAFETK